MQWEWDESAWEHHVGMACAAVRRAARICQGVQAARMRHASGAEVQVKADHSPVTVADYASQAVIAAALRAATPHIPLVAEEGSDALRGEDPAVLAVRDSVRYWLNLIAPDHFPAHLGPEVIDDALDWGNATPSLGPFWALDPIDGTKGFLRGEQYAIALALIVQGQPVLSVVAAPNLTLGDTRGVLAWARDGHGAWQGPLDAEGLAVLNQRLRVSDTVDPTQVRFCEPVESGHNAHDRTAALVRGLGTTAAPLRLDSQAKYLVVARGEADVYLRISPRADYAEAIWDHAAGMLLVQEAGGKVTDLLGNPLEFQHGRKLKNAHGIIASHEPIHQTVLGLFSSPPPP